MKAQELRSKKQEGASLVEFSLLAPLFVVLLFGLVEFGLSIYSKGVLANASREGASALTVAVTYPYTFQVLPNFVSSLAGTLNLTANTVMLME
jgi:Flp pilus assembly protein TadG